VRFGSRRRDGLLGEATVLSGQALADGRPLVAFTGAPCYTWQNRGIDEMTAWFLRTPSR